jgi:hypothetical protein
MFGQNQRNTAWETVEGYYEPGQEVVVMKILFLQVKSSLEVVDVLKKQALR